MKKQKTRKRYDPISTLVLVIMSLTVIFPLLWVLSTSLKGTQEFYFNIWGLPQEYVWQNYVEAWRKTNFGTNFLNSLLVTFGALAINLIGSTTTAYVLSRYRFRGRRFTNGVYMLSMMIPTIIGLIPQYFLLANMKLLDTHIGLILVYGLSSIPFSVFTLLGFFQTLPHALEEAALIDGASHMRTLVQIYLPVSLPAIATITLFCIVSHWNAWFDGMIYITTPSRVPMQTYLRSILIDMNVADMSADDYELYAMLANRTVKCSQIIVATIPILCVYPFLQRYFVSGIVLGSVKG